MHRNFEIMWWYIYLPVVHIPTTVLAKNKNVQAI